MSNEYQVLSERIYSDFPILGSCIRQRAAVALSKDKSPQAVKILAEAVVRSGDRKVITIALEALRNLRDRDSINAFCQVWAESRHKDLTTILKNRRYVSTEPKFLVLSALKVGTLDIVKRGNVNILEPLLAAISDEDTQIAALSVSCLSTLEDQGTIDSLCEKWVRSRSNQLEQIICQGGYVASQPTSVRVLTALKLNRIQGIVNGDEKVLDCVLDAYQDRDTLISSNARTCAANWENVEAIDKLCTKWANYRIERLEQTIQEGKYLPNQPVNVRVLVSLKFNRFQEIESDGTEVTDHLLAARYDKFPQIVEAANYHLNNLKNQEIIDDLCKKWVENSDRILEEIIRSNGYKPKGSITQALFYFLLGDWQKYEYLDFDQSLLASAYHSASPLVKRKLIDKARESGRVEGIKVLNTKQSFDFDTMQDCDWDYFTNILENNPDRNHIWNFLYNAPINWSKKLLDRLEQIPYKCFKQNEEITIKELISLSKKTEESVLLLVSRFFSLQYQETICVSSDYSFEDEPLAISPEGNFWVSLKFLESRISISLWDLQTGMFIKRFSSIPAKDLVRDYGYEDIEIDATISSDGSCIILRDRKYTHFYVLDLRKGKWFGSFEVEENSPDAKKYAFSPNAHFLASFNSGYSRIIELWHLDYEYIKIKTLTGHKGNINTVVFSPDGQTLASGSSDHTICLWSLKKSCSSYWDFDSDIGNQPKTIRGHSSITSLTVSHDNSILASGDINGNIDLWDLNNTNHLKTLKGCSSKSIRSLTISHDKNFLASVDTDGKINLWILSSNNHLKTLKGHNSIESLAISHDNSTLAFKEIDGNVKRWKFPSADHNPLISKFTVQDIAEIESKIKNPTIEQGFYNALKFTLVLIRLRQQFDIDIEEVSSDVQFSEFDIEIDG